VDVTCQICTIHGHPTSVCWWRFKNDDSDDEDDAGRGKKGAHVASYGVDGNWYSDTGATDHINYKPVEQAYHLRQVQGPGPRPHYQWKWYGYIAYWSFHVAYSP
jgi:hypothetical protein